MTPRWTSSLTGSTVYEADARVVAASMPAGGVTLNILDGPYGLGKADWDRVPRGGRLGDLYAGHLDDVGRLSAPSASLYLWNTSEGWAELHPLIVARGWTFRVLIVWDKLTPAAMLGWKATRSPVDTTEVCGLYGRGDWTHGQREDCKGNVWPFSMKALSLEALRTGETVAHRGTQGDVQVAVHPCQKPLLFAERMIRASSRPGDTIWAPFGGTLREMVAAERIARAEPSEARRVVTCELNKDGPDYIGAALAQIEGRPAGRTGQVGLFPGAR